MAEFSYCGQTHIQTGIPIKFKNGQPVTHSGWKIHIYEGVTEQEAKELAAANNRIFISWFDMDSGEAVYGGMEKERK